MTNYILVSIHYKSISEHQPVVQRAVSEGWGELKKAREKVEKYNTRGYKLNFNLYAKS